MAGPDTPSDPPADPAADPPAGAPAVVAGPVPDGSPQAAAAPPDAAPRRRAWRWTHAMSLVVWTAVVVGVPLALGWALLFHPRALPLLLQVAPGVQAQGVDGTLGGGRIRIAALDWTLPAKLGRLQIDQLALDGLDLRRTPHAGAWFALHWQALSADNVRFASGPPPAQPRTPPTDLRVPVVLDGVPVTVKRLQVDALPVARDAQARLSLGIDNGGTHRIDDLAFSLDALRARGQASIATTGTLALKAALDAEGSANPPWRAKATAQGPLTRLALQAELTGTPPRGQAPASLQAQATIAPFAPWPLAALALSTQALDLATLAPGLPHTLLDVQAKVQTAGLKAPLVVDGSLVNRQPGTLDSGRIPVRRLTLSLRGDLNHTDRALLDHFELLLGDAQASAGRASGSGHWQADTLTLALTLDDLQPARLHGAAAALSVSGPLSIQARGLPLPGQASTARTEPQAAVTATLQGRALDGSGLPVKIHLVAEGSARHLAIRQAEASAGDAQATLVLDAQARGSTPGRSQGDPTPSGGGGGPVPPPGGTVNAGWQLRGDLRLTRFDPLPWWRGNLGSAWRRGPHRLNADLHADLLWRGLPPDGLVLDQLLLAANGDATLRLTNSVVAGVPLEADWKLGSAGREITLHSDNRIAGNRLLIDGRGGGAPADDRWQIELQATALPALLPLRTLVNELAPGNTAELNAWWPVDGEATAHLDLNGRWPALRTQGDAQVSGLKAPAFVLQQAKARWRTNNEVDAPLMAEIDAQSLQVAGQRFDRLQAQADGSLKQHTLHFLADSPLRPPAWTENLLGAPGTGTRMEGRALGAWTPASGGGGTWRVRDLGIDGGARAADGGSRAWMSAKGLAAELRLDHEGQPQALVVAPGRVQLLSTALRWSEARWQAGPATAGSAGAAGGSGRFDLKAELETIDLAQLLRRMQPGVGWGGNLTLGGHIEVTNAERLDADVVLERLGGDLTLGDELGNVQPLGISDLRLALSAHDGLWQFAQGMAGRNLGEMAGAQVLRTGVDRRWPGADAPLQGVLEARVPDLGIWGTWVPPGWRLGGMLRTTASFGGTLGAPELRGDMQGSQLSVRNVLLGVNLAAGELAISLVGERAEVERFNFKGGDGTLTLTGGAVLGSAPKLDLVLAAEHFRVLGRIDRRIVVDGRATLQLDAQQLKVDGKVAVEEGLIDIGRNEAPRLDADVQVHRPTDGNAEAALPGATPLPAPLRNAQVTLAIDLGSKLRLRGRGIDTLLRGQLVVASPGGRLSLTGNVHGDGGTYTAYGQNLDITRGDLFFSGALDNPRLDVQATRPNLDVLVGVAITGPALNPRIRLFSEPELAEYDKLSWLVLGRSPDGLGRTDTALLQRAAMALLAGDGKAPTDELLGALGITDFSLRQTEGTARETIVSLGRQLSRRWYVGYERSVNATTGTWQLVYRVAQRFTLRAQSGTENAVDAIWSWRW